MADYAALQDALIEGDEDGLLEEVDALLGQGVAPVDIIAQGMMGAMEVVGARFSTGEMFVPEVLMCANAMNLAVDRLHPLLEGVPVTRKGKVVIGTVKGDLHDIGKNLVAMFMDVSGYEVVDLGTDVSPDAFLQEVQQGAQIVAMSALLTTTMPVMGQVVRTLEDNGLREQVKVIVGGAPLSQGFADEIRADGYSKDAAGAVRLCTELLAGA